MSTYTIKATWAGFALDTYTAHNIEDARNMVEGTEETEGICGKFHRGGYTKVSGGMEHSPKALCVDVLLEGKICKAYNFSR